MRWRIRRATSAGWPRRSPSSRPMPACAPGIRVHQLGETRVSRPYTVHRARRVLAALLARERFDRVICHAAWSYAIFARIVRRMGVPLVFWAHDAVIGHHWSERWASRTPPDLVIANSRFTSSTLSAMYDGVPVAVVYAPVDTATPQMPGERGVDRRQFATAP